MPALDVGNNPAVGSVDDDEIERDRAAVIVEGDGDVGLVELLAKDCYRDRAKLPCRALDEKIVGLILQGTPCTPQTLIEELARGGGIAGQPARQIGRPVAVIGIDVPDQRFRRAETSLGGRETKTGQQNQECSDDFRHRRLALFAALLIVRLRANSH
jgi:hypothetical protein